MTPSDAMAERPQDLKDLQRVPSTRVVFRMPFETFSGTTVARPEYTEDGMISVDYGPYDKTYVTEEGDSERSRQSSGTM